MYNPTAESVSLADMTACWLEISVNDAHRLGAPCTGGVSNLMPGEVMLVDQVSAALTSKVSISTPGDSFVFNSAEASATTTASPTLEMELALSGNELPAYSPSEVLVLSLIHI